jgi:nicotinamide-nucleotide amidase
MTAEVISIGTELLLGQIVDSNAAYLGKVLAETGISHTHRQTVGDNLQRISSALELALSRAEIVITIGGLGPTEDDLTREAIAIAMDEALVEDQEVVDQLRSWFASRNLTWVESLRRQALRPACAEPIPNPNGTAPGLMAEKTDKLVMALPGPPSEFRPMVDHFVQPKLAKRSGAGVIVSRVLRIIGMGESMVESMVSDLLQSTNPTVAPLAHTGEVHLRLTARSENRATALRLIEPLESEIRRRLGNAVYGADDENLEVACLHLLSTKQATVAVAESCTGGLLGSRMSSVPGASKAFLGGAITYSNEAKVEILGVSQETLDQFGAVSAATASQMAAGARRAFGSSHALSITGIAGPDGGSDEKPVGLVFIGVAKPDGVEVHEHRFSGGRDNIRQRAAQAALMRLRACLL